MGSRSNRMAGTFIFIGTVQFAFFFALAEIFYPGYSVSANTISDLGATCRQGDCLFIQPSSEIFDSTISLLGLLLIGGSYFLWKGYESRALAFFVALSGVSAFGIGVFNESFGAVHGLFSLATFVSIGVQAILVFRVVKPPMSYFSLVAGVVTLVALVLYVTGTYLGLGQGGMERMIVYPVLLAGIAFGGYLLSASETDLR
jgi:hypothetical membrane protein